VQQSNDALFANSFTRRRALRLVGTGIMLGVPFATLVATANAERAPIAAAAALPVPTPTPPSAPPPAAPTHAPPPAASAPPAAASAPPALPARFATVAETPLWADAAGSLPLGIAPTAAILEPLETATGPLIQVHDAYSGATSFVDRSRLRPVAVPAPPAAPGRWWGHVTVDGANLRSAPKAQAPVIADNPAWAQLNDHTFIYSAETRPVDLPSAPPVPVNAPPGGRWIDVNLTQQVVVAYEGRPLVRMARTSTGRPGFETPPGAYAILWRVASETMTSAGVVGTGGQTHQFGIPSSHGCAGLLSADAQFFWDWASVGTPIVVHG
jgi:hypothetical protein